MENIYTQSTNGIFDPVIFLGRWEFIFYLTAAMILGYLIHYVFSRRRDYVRTPRNKPSFYYNDNLNSAYYPNSEPIYPNTIVQSYELPFIEQQTPIQENSYELYNDSVTSQIPQQNFVVNELQNQKSQKDDLKVVEGIGPKIEEIINKSNINTWHQLSKTPIEELKMILKKAGKRFQMHNPSTWPEQAHLAETKQWAALEAFQDYLDGGKIA